MSLSHGWVKIWGLRYSGYWYGWRWCEDTKKGGSLGAKGLVEMGGDKIWWRWNGLWGGGELEKNSCGKQVKREREGVKIWERLSGIKEKGLKGLWLSVRALWLAMVRYDLNVVCYELTPLCHTSVCLGANLGLGPCVLCNFIFLRQ